MSAPHRRYIASCCLLLAALVAGLLGSPTSPAAAQIIAQQPGQPTPGPAGPIRPVTGQSLQVDVSPALASMPVQPARPAPNSLNAAARPRPLGKVPAMQGEGTPATDAVVQNGFGLNSMPSPIRTFEGINNRDGALPPDTQGDVGLNHYIEWVNLSFQIFDKSGQSLYGPAAGNTLFSGLGGPCETSNDGDPVTLYDQLADRWLMSQFAIPNYPNGPFYECIAISATGDPLGSWYRYAFRVHETKMNDYPKLAVWPDGYYMTVNQFNADDTWAGAGVYAFERSKMLQGQGAQFVYFDLYNANSNFGGMLPASLAGKTLPPAATPAYFMEADDWGTSDALRLWELRVNWPNTGASTFGLAGQPNQVLTTAAFDSNLCNFTPSCIPQPGTGQGLDAIADRLMFRLQYRNFGDHQALVANHTVDVGGDHAGIRWYELRRTSGPWSIYQQSTYAPDASHRWMGSIAMDGAGNIALGYSVSSSSVYPAIRYAGRLAGDPLNQLSQGEAELKAGGGSQTSGYARWGDYSVMSVDPADDCTFWYINEYLAATSNASWRTRVGSFKFPGCGAPTAGTLSGHVTDFFTHGAVSGAQVQATNSQNSSIATTTTADGSYSIQLPAGTYTVKTTRYGYLDGTSSNVTVGAGSTTTLDVALVPQGDEQVTGRVTDAATGWPLYASVQIAGYPNNPVWTDPLTGIYHVSLARGYNAGYNFQVLPWANGYVTATASLTSLIQPTTLDFAVLADATACSAPGRVSSGGTCGTQTGGLLVGSVSDANTGAALAGGTVAGDGGSQVSTWVTADPAVADGFYTLFSPAGSHTLTAGKAGYQSTGRSVTVTAGQTTRQDFALPAGRLSATPAGPAAGLSATVIQGAATTATLQIANTGSAAATFSFGEVAAVAQAGVIQRPPYALKPFKQNAATAQGLALAPAPSAPLFPNAGAILGSWQPAGVAGAYGVAYDNRAGTVWVASPGPYWGGQNLLVEYTTAGAATGRAQRLAWQPTHGPADAAFDGLSGRLWLMSTEDADNCIYEVDPDHGASGRKVCPGSGLQNSQRGLAYDPTTDTWFAGGWNDFMIYRFDSAGKMLQAINVGVSTSGLAYNPTTQHLFAMTNNAPNTVYVLDAANDFALVGRFTPAAGFADYSGAGLDLDCQGHLWAVDHASGTVYEMASGETTGICAAGVGWLSETPAGGTIAAGGTQAVTVGFDSTSGISTPGQYHARLTLNHDTPYVVADIPVTLTVIAATHVVAVTPAATWRPGKAGLSRSYQLELTNQGNVTDTFTVSSSGIWPAHAPATVGPLGPGQTATLTVTVDVPAGAAAGAADDTTVRITSQADPSATATATLTTRTGMKEVLLPLTVRNRPPANS